MSPTILVAQTYGSCLRWILNLKELGILVLNYLFATPSFRALLLRPPPFLPFRVAVIKWPFLWYYNTNIRINEVARERPLHVCLRTFLCPFS